MSIKYRILGKLLSLLLLTFSVMDICAQKNESWNSFDLEDFSLSVPKHLDKNLLNQKPRKLENGFTLVRHMIGSRKEKGERGKEALIVEIRKYTNKNILSIDERFNNIKNTYKRLFNAKTKKRKAQNPCDLHCVVTFEGSNPFTDEIRHRECYHWLYKHDNTIFVLKISFSSNFITDKQDLIQTIDKIQSTFIIK